MGVRVLPVDQHYYYTTSTTTSTTGLIDIKDMEVPADIRHLYITWLDEAAAKFQARQQKSAMILSNASRALKRHEGPVRYPEELTKIKGIGQWISQQMNSRLEAYCEEEGWTLPVAPEKPVRAGKRVADDTRKTKRKKQYVPQKRSGGYAILLTLLEFDETQDGLTKDVISANASPYCNSSFSANPSTSQFYSAWSSVKTLIKEGLVSESGRPVRYYLTDEGVELAKKIKENDDVVFRGNAVESLPENTVEVRVPRDRVEECYQGVNYFYWEVGSYDIKFVVDNREIRSTTERDFFGTKLQQLGIECIKRPLTVGDGLWIARHNVTNEEVVLNYILERKRLDDLAQSIQDGRYTEQKSRLKRTGIENVYYIIEEVTSSDLANMSTAIQTAISLNLTVSDFHVQRTKDADATVQFIATITKQIQQFYSKRRILVLKPRDLNTQLDYKKILESFRGKFQTNKVDICHQYFTFDALLSKTAMMTTRELFVRMLMTIRGITLEKAIAIQREFPTPTIMFEQFDANDREFQSKYGKRVAELLGEIFTK